MSERFSSVLVIVLLLTTTMMPGGMTGTVAAQDSGDVGVCFDENLDWLITYVTPGQDPGDRCTWRSKTIEEMKQSDKNQTKVDIYSTAQAEKAQKEAFVSVHDNYLQDTESVAWMKAEAAIAEAYNDGKSKAEVKVAAREAISEYYSTKQINLVKSWNTTVTSMGYLDETSRMEGMSEDFVDMKYNDESADDSYIAEWGNNTATVTTVNSTQVEVATISGQWMTPYPSSSIDFTAHVASGVESRDGVQPLSSIGVRAPNSNYEYVEVFNHSAYNARWNRIEAQNNALQNETDQFVEATWQDFDSGQITSTDVISSHTAMFEYGVRSGNESEGLYSSTAALAMMGYDTPNLNSSGTMQVTYRGVDYRGLLMARHAPNGSWDANTTYNTSNIDGPVFMVTTAGEKIDFGDNTEFTVGELKAKDGTAVQETETTKYVYKTANTSEMLEMQEELIDLRQEIEDREPDAGAGGGPNFDFNLGQFQLVGAGAVGILALLGAVMFLME